MHAGTAHPGVTGMTVAKDIGLEPGMGGVRNALRHPVQSSYAANQWVDDLFHNAVYIAKRDKGFTEAQAVAQANKIMGDFGRMSRFERGVKTIIPFYPWARHITMLSARLARDDPIRVAWTLHLADLYGDKDTEDRPGWLKGAAKVGPNRYASIGSLNPFGDVPNSPFLSPAGLAGSITPLIKVPVALGTGQSISRQGINPLTRPAGFGPTNMGKPSSGHLNWFDKHLPFKGIGGEAAYYLSRQTPLSRGLYDIAARPVARYQTGYPAKRGGQPIPVPGGRAQAARRLTGLPFPETINVDEMKAAAQKREQRNTSSRRRYEGDEGDAGGWGG
jgi:hypothetical protein